eukprot:scaffold22560_cov135-Cylindrotheca_fusiformis.AAC.63
MFFYMYTRKTPADKKHQQDQDEIRKVLFKYDLFMYPQMISIHKRGDVTDVTIDSETSTFLDFDHVAMVLPIITCLASFRKTHSVEKTNSLFTDSVDQSA